MVEPVEAYVHVARSLTFDGRSLTLVDLSPSTIWVSPSPAAGLGYLPTGAFLDVWDHLVPDQAPGARSVTGTLSLLDPDAQPAGNAILTLSNPRITAQGLTYDAEITQGLVPPRSGACVLILERCRTSTASHSGVPPAPPEPDERPGT
ncbi:MAG TPA: hypothetical protein PLP61_00500 [Nocardioides sp.]|uniref:hypothetical protein n=1 Tax=Nocardioides sp. TaxID=35761 RepID=UPI002CE28DAE|nr:hypothetical protein [Nocardioides sp.]HQR25493.1 hypothetical protein [Nocardioides sp.]